MKVIISVYVLEMERLFWEITIRGVFGRGGRGYAVERRFNGLN